MDLFLLICIAAMFYFAGHLVGESNTEHDLFVTKLSAIKTSPDDLIVLKGPLTTRTAKSLSQDLTATGKYNVIVCLREYQSLESISPALMKIAGWERIEQSNQDE